MKVKYKNKELRINYRFPWEFIFCAWKFRKAMRIWVIYYWNDDMKNLWQDKGYRFLGIEFMYRIYGRTPNRKVE